MTSTVGLVSPPWRRLVAGARRVATGPRWLATAVARRAVAPTALVVAVPEAEPLRARAWAGAAHGPDPTPAHVTVLYPFAPRWQVQPRFVAQLRQLCARRAPLELAFGRVERFSGDEQVTYLAPEPVGPVVELTLALAARWPRWQPYGGRFETVVPHLTLLAGQPASADLERRLAPLLPLHTSVSELLLVLPHRRGWKVLARCPLGPGVPPS